MQAQITTPVARLSENEDGHVVHGVAIGEDDRTNGLHSLKRWPREALEPAAASLAGTPVTDRHGGDRVGQVIRSAYEPDVGVVYEATLSDEGLANQLSLGQRDVSIEAHNPERVEHDDEGAAILHGFEFSGMAIVENGASPSNHSSAGSASDNQAIAALSAGDIQDALSDQDNTGSPPEGDDSPSATEETSRSGETDADNNSSTTMSEDEDSGEEYEKLAAKLAERDDRVEEQSEQIEELKEKNAELAGRVEELEDATEEVATVKEVYAAELADGDRFSEDELVEKFSVAELREKFETDDESDLVESEPDVQTGGGDDESAALSLDDGERKEAQDIKQRIEYWDGKNETIVEAEKAELAELAGADSADDVMEAI